VEGDSNDGEIYLSFTNKMLFPADLKRLLNLGYVEEADPISTARLLSDE
jgi:hypothetical protein